MRSARMGAAQASAVLCAQFAKALRIRHQRFAPVAVQPDQRVSRQKQRHAGPKRAVARDHILHRRQTLARAANAECLGRRDKHPAPRGDPHPGRQRKGRRQNRPTGPEHFLRTGVAGQNPVPGSQGADRAQPAGNRDMAPFLVGGGPLQPLWRGAGGRLPSVVLEPFRRARFMERPHGTVPERRALAKSQGARKKVYRIYGMSLWTGGSGFSPAAPDNRIAQSDCAGPAGIRWERPPTTAPKSRHATAAHWQYLYSRTHLPMRHRPPTSR
jgi:hypothetical protein